MTETALLDHLARCQAAELIRQVQVIAEPEYWFKHTLVQEAAYESLLKSARAELHGRVAAALEAGAGESGGHREADAAVLALHYERAGMEAAALPYAIMAADRARRTYAHREAIALYDKALAIVARLDNSQYLAALRTIYVNRGKVFEVSGNPHAALDNYHAMMADARRVGDVAMQADAMNHLATVQSVTAERSNELWATLNAALDLARRSGETVLIGRALWNMGLHKRFHDPLAAIEYLEDALAVAEAAPGDLDMRDLAAAVWNDLFICYSVVGQSRRAMAARMHAIAAFRELDNRPMLADALGGAAILFHRAGDFDQARAFATEGMVISQATGNPWGVVFNGWSIQEIEIDTGDFEATLNNANRRVAAARGVAFPVFTGLVLSQIARAHRELGQVDRMQPLAEESAELFAMQGMPSWVIWGRGVLGDAALARGDLAAAQAALEPIWREGGDPIHAFQGYLAAGPAYVDWALTAGHVERALELCNWMLARLEPEEAWRSAGEMRYERGRTHVARGDLASAETDLLEARDRLAHAGVTILTWKADAALADLFRGQGDTVRADEALQAARHGITRLADGIHDEGLRRSFMARSDVQEVLST